MAHVLAVANQKGGVAKTTTVASLGVALHDLGKRVLLVDLDLAFGDVVLGDENVDGLALRGICDRCLHGCLIGDIR